MTSLLLLLLLTSTTALHDDFFYFTSFEDVKEWKVIYPTCDINFDFQYLREGKIRLAHYRNTDEALEQEHEANAGADVPQPLESEIYSLDPKRIPHNLSPIAINHKETTCMTDKAERCPPNLRKPGDPKEQVLMIFNNKAPDIGAYSVSYGFQRNKECLTSTLYTPCYVSPSAGKIRAVVLTAERQSVNDVRQKFTVEEPEKFVSIINGGNGNERKFHEAIFLGTGDKRDCKSGRSTHVIDGKCYPMEIYMFFMDETLPVMAAATVLVVLVEEDENDNPQVSPIVNAVHLARPTLYEAERQFLKDHDQELKFERMFHHMGPSTVLRSYYNETDFDGFVIPATQDVERNTTKMLDHFERIQAYKARMYFNIRLYDSIQKDLEEARNIKNILDYKVAIVEDPSQQLKCSTSTGILEKMCKVAELFYALGFDKTIAYLKEAKRNEQDKELDVDIIKHPLPDKVTGEGIDAAIVSTLQEYLTKSYAFEFMKMERSTGDKIVMTLKDRIDQFQRMKNFRNSDIGALKDTLKELITKYTGMTDNDKVDLFMKALYKNVLDEGSYRVARLEAELQGEYFKTIKDYYIEVGFPEKDIPNPKDKTKVVKSGFATLNADVYVEDQIRIIDDDNQEHPLEYHRLKKTEPRKHNFKYAVGSAEGRDKGAESPADEVVLLGNLQIPRDRYFQYENTNPTKVHVKNKFQISWLIPRDGGYYRYKGSSPVPPCFGAEETIVFRKPIKMSKEQIKILSTVPTTLNIKRDITSTLGILHPRRKSEHARATKVYFEPRNHQFLSEDGYHGNSVLEYGRRKDKKSGVGGRRVGVVLMVVMMTMVGMAFVQ